MVTIIQIMSLPTFLSILLHLKSALEEKVLSLNTPKLFLSMCLLAFLSLLLPILLAYFIREHNISLRDKHPTLPFWEGKKQNIQITSRSSKRAINVPVGNLYPFCFPDSAHWGRSLDIQTEVFAKL